MITVLDNNRNIGISQMGITREVKFTIQNTYDSKYMISDLKPGCGSCTTAKVDSGELQSLGSVILTAMFTPNSQGYNDKKVDVYLTNYSTGERTSVTARFNSLVQ